MCVQNMHSKSDGSAVNFWHPSVDTLGTLICMNLWKPTMLRARQLDQRLLWSRCWLQVSVATAAAALFLLSSDFGWGWLWRPADKQTAWRSHCPCRGPWWPRRPALGCGQERSLLRRFEIVGIDCGPASWRTFFEGRSAFPPIWPTGFWPCWKGCCPAAGHCLAWCGFFVSTCCCQGTLGLDIFRIARPFKARLFSAQVQHKKAIIILQAWKF